MRLRILRRAIRSGDLDGLLDVLAVQPLEALDDRTWLLDPAAAAGGGHGPPDPASGPGGAYLAEHDIAVRWPALNRRVIAERATAAMGAACRVIANLSHNLVEVQVAVSCIARAPHPPIEASCPSPGRGARCLWSSR